MPAAREVKPTTGWGDSDAFRWQVLLLGGHIKQQEFTAGSVPLES